MKKEKGKNILIGILIGIIIVLIVLIILFTTNTISFNKEVPSDTKTQENSDHQKQENNNQSSNNESTISLQNWMEYILNTDIQNITLVRTRATMNETEEDYYKTVALNKDDLRNIFTELNQLKLIKKYSQGMGVADGDTLKISYKLDNVDYILEIPNGYIFTETIQDQELLRLIEQSSYTTENEELKDQEGSFYVFKLGSNFNSSIFDNYFSN